MPFSVQINVVRGAGWSLVIEYICDWIWKNLSVTHKDKYFEIGNSIIQSVLCILRTLKAAGLQFALNLYKSTHSTVCSYVAEIPAILDGF